MVRNSIKNNQRNILDYEKQIRNKQDENKEASQKLLRANEFIKTFDFDSLNASRKQYEQLTVQLDKVIGELQK